MNVCWGFGRIKRAVLHHDRQQTLITASVQTTVYVIHASSEVDNNSLHFKIILVYLSIILNIQQWALT